MNRPLRRITHGRPLATLAIDGLGEAHAVAHRPRTETANHRHQQASLTLVVGGAIEERGSGGARACGPLSVLFKPAGLEHASAVGACAVWTLTLALEPAAVDDDLAALDRPVRAAGGPAVRELIRALGATRDGDRSGALDGSVRCAIAELAALVRARRRLEDHHRDDPLEASLTTLNEPGSVAAAASAARMHRSAYARAFRARYACSPTEHRRRAQVARAAGALAVSGDSIAAVAFYAGFADQAHLCRAFRRETGVTPSAYRALAARTFAAV